jgi:hypothetical protein
LERRKEVTLKCSEEMKQKMEMQKARIMFKRNVGEGGGERGGKGL